MSRKRKDNWTDEENLTLVNTILEHTKSGKKLRVALEVCSDRLGNRTYEACQYHWSKVLQKDHLVAYNHAKAEGLLGRTI